MPRRTNPILNQSPLGVSEWRELGKRFGFWDYFIKQNENEKDETIKQLQYLKDTTPNPSYSEAEVEYRVKKTMETLLKDDEIKTGTLRMSVVPPKTAYKISEETVSRHLFMFFFGGAFGLLIGFMLGYYSKYL